MKSELISKRPKKFVVVFKPGDEVMNGLKAFAAE